MRTMYDSVDVAGLPDGGDLYAGYIDGRYRNVDAIQARFPGKRVVRIAVFASTPGGEVYDVETGDLTPDQIPGVLQRERAAGRNPTMYVNLSNWGACKQACIDHQLAQPPYWVAHYTMTAHIENGSVATQWGDYPEYDVSQVADFWPGVDTATPLPVLPDQSYPGDNMVRHSLTITTDGNGNGYNDLPVPFDAVVSLFANGADPQTNSAYSPIPRLSASAEGAGTRVELEAGPTSGQVLVFVATAS